MVSVHSSKTLTKTKFFAKFSNLLPMSLAHYSGKFREEVYKQSLCNLSNAVLATYYSATQLELRL